MTTGFTTINGRPVITKDPAAALDYTVDWSPWLIGGDTLASATFSADAGLTVVSQANSTTMATVWLSGGTAGTTYTVTCRIVTVAGRTDERAFGVACKNR